MPEWPTQTLWLTCNKCWLKDMMPSHRGVWACWWPARRGDARLVWFLHMLPRHLFVKYKNNCEYIFKLPVGFVSSNFNCLIYQTRVNGRMSCLTEQRVTNFMGATQIQITPQTHVPYNRNTILKGNEQAFKWHKMNFQEALLQHSNTIRSFTLVIDLLCPIAGLVQIMNLLVLQPDIMTTDILNHWIPSKCIKFHRYVDYMVKLINTVDVVLKNKKQQQSISTSVKTDLGQSCNRKCVRNQKSCATSKPVSVSHAFFMKINNRF